MITKSCACPLCGKTLDAWTCVSERDAAPTVGDFSLCLGCGALLVFAEDLSVRLATQAEKDDLGRCHPSELELIMRAQRKILERAHPRVLGLTYGSEVEDQGYGPCYRCGRSMKVLCPGKAFAVPRIDICTDCLPFAMKEVELPQERGVIVFPKSWAHSRKAASRRRAPE